ncbi:unnamed protein product [Allacma fusca]|uniref:Uncharacterized protein n=1 Tax=Allacma fusca TaxID=39272 RepID=A0A8J2P8A4_9HEXA|nr:unnamed protein product [Allacma fusca]
MYVRGQNNFRKQSFAYTSKQNRLTSENMNKWIILLSLLAVATFPEAPALSIREAMRRPGQFRMRWGRDTAYDNDLQKRLYNYLDVEDYFNSRS